MGIYSTKASWQRAIQTLVAYCVRRKVHPDVFTYSALALSSIAGLALFLAGKFPGLLWLVPGCVLVRLLLNLMDGQVARRLGLADRWGEVKNEFGDRLADTFVFLGLGLGGYADARLCMLALALILCTSYLGILSKALGSSRLYAGVFGKGDRMVSLAAFTVYPLISGHLSSYNHYLAAAVLLAAITIIQRLVLIYRNIQSEGGM
jgi:CDP-diacylglycerol--glycerol-3-phosphate 3-phosphatidyltransferase